MTTLFDIELYQGFEKQGTQRDWDKVFYDPAWDEANSLTDIEQNKVLGEEEENLSPEKKCLSGLSDSKFSESITVKSADTEQLTPTPQSSIQREQESDRLLSNHSLKAISLWQPYCSLIALGLKRYETRSWKTNHRGKLLICSTAKLTKKQYQQYLKIGNSLELPVWSEINFPCGKAIAICDLVDCIPITPSFIAQQLETEVLCGDWEVGRYAWKLENIQLITEPFAVKGKQGLFNICVDTLPFNSQIEKFINTKGKTNKSLLSDEWYTPPHISELVIQVLLPISLDPCADEGKHIRAVQHYTAPDDGLIQEWNGRVFMNPPYSQPSVWIKKLQAEFESGRVTEAIILVPASTDTKWLSAILKSQPVCFWTGRIKFLDTNYKPRLSARQSHCLIYWGKNWERFKEVFDPYGVVYPPASIWVNKNVATQDAVLPVKRTSSTLLEKQSLSVLPVGQTSSTQLEKQPPPVLPVGTSSTQLKKHSPSVLPIGTSSTQLEENSPSVLPVGRTSSTHSEQQPPPVLPVGTSSTQLEKHSPSVLPIGTSSTQLEENSPSVLPVERTSSTTRRSYGEGTGRIHWRGLLLRRAVNSTSNRGTTGS